jgi:hypothetical protein
MTSKTYTKTALTSAVLGTLLATGSAFAQTPPATNTAPYMKGEMKEIRQEMKENRKEIKGVKQAMKELPTVAGTVTSVNGLTLTISGATAPKMATSSFTVILTSSTVVVKNKATTTASSIVVGDKVAVLGTLSGSSVSATSLMVDPKIGEMAREIKNGGKSEMMAMMQGNGAPLVGGSISAISGNTLTITNKGGAIYTVDATSAKVAKGGQGTTTVSTLKVGDMIMVQGAVNGTTITANSIVLQPAGERGEMKRAMPTNPSMVNQALQAQGLNQNDEQKPKFLERMGEFFKSFGF